MDGSRHLVALTGVIFVVSACGETTPETDIERVANRMDAVQEKLASASADRRVSLCLEYVGLCERGLGLCLAGDNAARFATFCVGLGQRCEATSAQYCSGGVVDLADAGVPPPDAVPIDAAPAAKDVGGSTPAPDASVPAADAQTATPDTQAPSADARVLDPDAQRPSTPDSRPPPAVGGAYQHVRPSQVGVSIGVGVTGPQPTEVYTGSSTIASATTIENKVVNACLRIEADSVTIRNSIITCGGLYPVQVKNGSRNFTLEYSKVVCKSGSKIIYFTSGAPNARVAHNELRGCEDFFFIQGDLDGVVVKNNYMHSILGTAKSHADGFQIGEASTASGMIQIQGNYFDANNPSTGKTDILFATNHTTATILFEDNYMEPWGHYTLRCTGAAHCTARNNVYSNAFLTSEHSGRYYRNGIDVFTCNRYANGDFLNDDRFGNMGNPADCPPFGD